MAADTKLSKSLAYVLRHQAHKLGFKVYPGGFLNVEDLLAHKLFRRYTLVDIERVVAADTKKRYSFKDDADLGLKLLAANQGHSFQVEAPEITEVTDAGQFPVVVHGTYLKNWPQIKKQGLNRMGRTHIHFAQGEPADSEVISGMRNSCQVMIFINLKKALDDGFKFYLSKNGVILCPGDDSGSLSPHYFSEVIQRHPRMRLDIGEV